MIKVSRPLSNEQLRQLVNIEMAYDTWRTQNPIRRELVDRLEELGKIYRALGLPRISAEPIVLSEESLAGYQLAAKCIFVRRRPTMGIPDLPQALLAGISWHEEVVYDRSNTAARMLIPDPKVMAKWWEGFDKELASLMRSHFP